MLDLPHHISPTRPRMPVPDRAAQFAPFAALTGHEAAIRETARRTEMQIELDESRKALLNAQLQLIICSADRQPEITVTYFCPDDKKDGGAYLQAAGRVRKIDPHTCTLFLTDGTTIPIEQIYELDGDLFQCFL